MNVEFKVTNGIIIGLVIWVISSLQMGLITMASIEFFTLSFIFASWIYRGYRPVPSDSFLASITYTNSLSKVPDFDYIHIMQRISIRVIALIGIVFDIIPIIFLLILIGTFIYYE